MIDDPPPASPPSQPAPRAQTGLYEDVLATLRFSAMIARRQHPREQAPLAWLDAFIQQMTALGWDTISRNQTERVYTPAPQLWTEVFQGQAPAAQPANTRFRTLVTHVLNARSDGSQPLPRSVSDDNRATSLVTELEVPPVGAPTVRVVQLAGAPDPQAPKTRLPLARTCWKASFDTDRFETLRSRFDQQLLALETASDVL